MVLHTKMKIKIGRTIFSPKLSLFEYILPSNLVIYVEGMLLEKRDTCSGSRIRRK